MSTASDIHEILARVRRIETRLCTLMEYEGMQVQTDGSYGHQEGQMDSDVRMSEEAK